VRSSVATSYLARQALPVAIKAIGKDIPDDAVLKRNSIPAEMINSGLTKHAGFKSSWKFCGAIRPLNNVFRRISPEQKAEFGTIESQIGARAILTVMPPS
jgi:hypothetical protein